MPTVSRVPTKCSKGTQGRHNLGLTSGRRMLNSVADDALTVRANTNGSNANSGVVNQIMNHINAVTAGPGGGLTKIMQEHVQQMKQIHQAKHANVKMTTVPIMPVQKASTTSVKMPMQMQSPLLLPSRENTQVDPPAQANPPAQSIPPPAQVNPRAQVNHSQNYIHNRHQVPFLPASNTHQLPLGQGPASVSVSETSPAPAPAPLPSNKDPHHFHHNKPKSQPQCQVSTTPSLSQSAPAYLPIATKKDQNNNYHTPKPQCQVSKNKPPPSSPLLDRACESIDPGTGKILHLFYSVSQAEKETGEKNSNIQHVCQQGGGMVGKYFFRFVKKKEATPFVMKEILPKSNSAQQLLHLSHPNLSSIAIVGGSGGSNNKNNSTQSSLTRIQQQQQQKKHVLRCSKSVLSEFIKSSKNTTIPKNFMNTNKEMRMINKPLFTKQTQDGSKDQFGKQKFNGTAMNIPKSANAKKVNVKSTIGNSNHAQNYGHGHHRITTSTSTTGTNGTLHNKKHFNDQFFIRNHIDKNQKKQTSRHLMSKATEVKKAIEAAGAYYSVLEKVNKRMIVTPGQEFNNNSHKKRKNGSMYTTSDKKNTLPTKCEKREKFNYYKGKLCLSPNPPTMTNGNTTTLTVANNHNQITAQQQLLPIQQETTGTNAAYLASLPNPPAMTNGNTTTLTVANNHNQITAQQQLLPFQQETTGTNAAYPSSLLLPSRVVDKKQEQNSLSKSSIQTNTNTSHKSVMIRPSSGFISFSINHKKKEKNDIIDMTKNDKIGMAQQSTSLPSFSLPATSFNHHDTTKFHPISMKTATMPATVSSPSSHSSCRTTATTTAQSSSSDSGASRNQSIELQHQGLKIPSVYTLNEQKECEKGTSTVNTSFLSRSSLLASEATTAATTIAKSSSNNTSLVDATAKDVEHFLSVDHQGLCIFCQDTKACVKLIPCHHCLFCKDCFLNDFGRKFCPVCRTSITSSVALSTFKATRPR